MLRIVFSESNSIFFFILFVELCAKGGVSGKKKQVGGSDMTALHCEHFSSG